MELFFTNNIIGSLATLDEQESAHCIKVLRNKPGDSIFLTDGSGILFRGEIVSVTGKKCNVNIVERISGRDSRPYYLHVAAAPTKNLERYEWFLEKATEFGVDEITPILAAHSERKVYKKERGERIILSAMKQSLKVTLPKLNEPEDFEKFVSEAGKSFDGDKLIGHCNEGEKVNLTNHLLALKETREKLRVLILIGPEGDFSPEEVELAKKKGFIPFTMGDSRFRVETAAIAAVSAVYFLSQKQ